MNKAFPDSSRGWTIQRKDVDEFFGAHFESEFVGLQHLPLVRSNEILVDKDAARHLKPRLFLDGQPVEHYVPGSNSTPPHFSQVIVDSARGPVPLVLKLHPDVTVASENSQWRIVVEKDLRIAALVSLLKAAHLTLFDMLGYGYALSAAGHYLGRDILGKFFLEQTGQLRPAIAQAAIKHFAETMHMVRPATESPTPGSLGTVSDRHLHICFKGTEIRWAFLLLIKTGSLYSAVLVPTCESPLATDTFFSFIRGDLEEFEARYTIFEGNQWRVSTQSRKVVWPKRDVSLQALGA